LVHDLAADGGNSLPTPITLTLTTTVGKSPRKSSSRSPSSGHLWQGRFFSSALDEAYLWAALRYVERNPVRARLVRKAESYPWSSAAAHCGRREDPVLTTARPWRERLAAVADWSAWLAEGDEAEEMAMLRRNVDKGLPCGADAFVRRLEALAGRPLRFRPLGRPRRREDRGGARKG
jgi:REP-associated tyrosine transposase